MGKVSLEDNLKNLVDVSKQHLLQNGKLEMWQNRVFLMEIIHKLSIQLDFIKIFEIALKNNKDLRQNLKFIEENQLHFLYRLITDLIILLYKRFETYTNLLNDAKSLKAGINLQIQTLENEINKFKFQKKLIKFLRDILFHIEYSWIDELKNIFTAMKNANEEGSNIIFAFLDLEFNEIEFTKENLINKYKSKNINSSNKLVNNQIIYSNNQEIECNKNIGLQIGDSIIKIDCELFVEWLLSLLFTLMDNNILINSINFLNIFIFKK